MHPSSPDPLLSVRAALVLLLAFITGVLAGALAYMDEHSIPSAVLWGCGAAAAALGLFHGVIDH